MTEGLQIRLLLRNGKKHVFQIPSDCTVDQFKEIIFKEWPEGTFN